MGVLTILGFLVDQFVGYRVVAFLLLVGVSIMAMFLDIIPVLLAAALSVLIWDYFFIPPTFALTVGTADDQTLLFTFFLVALINGVLTHRIRRIEKEAKAKDEKANSVKLYDTLLNSLSHELRTPITTIIGCADNLQSYAANLSEANKAELISEISIASIRLNQQVENLLNMSRLQSGIFKVKLDWVDVSDLVNKAIQHLDSNLQKFEVHTFINDQLPLFKVDFGLMEQVLHNLLINVTQHTPEGTQVKIHAQALENKLIIIVRDNGPGFPQADIEKAFDKFYRVNGSITGGTGLGLSIVKGFVEAHGGVIRLSNDTEGGSRFDISIPTETLPVNKLKNE